MNKIMMTAVIGFMAGLYVGYHNEDELHDICRQGQRTSVKQLVSFIRLMIRCATAWTWNNPEIRGFHL